MRDRLRVLYLSGWPIGARGQGAISFVYEQIDALSHDVEAAFMEHRFATVPGWLARRARGETLELIEDLWPERVTAFRVYTPRISTRLTGRSVLEDVARAGGGLASQVLRAFGKPDLIHAHVTLPAGLLAIRLATSLDIPVLLQEHSSPFEMHLDTAEKREFVQEVLDNAWRVGAVGDDLATRMHSAGAPSAKIVKLPNLVSTDRFSAQPQRLPAEPLRLISVASLTERKGLAKLIRAVATIKRSGRSVRLTIVGDGPLRNSLERLAASLGMSPGIRFEGHLERDAVAAAVADSHIYICASEQETFGLAPAEALAIGRPVVTTACGGPEEFVGASEGVVVGSNEPPDLAHGILSVAERLGEFDHATLHASISSRFGPTVFRQRVLATYHEAREASQARGRNSSMLGS